MINMRKIIFLLLFIGLESQAQPQTVGAGSDLRLWYRQPAQKWTEALPIGNGRLGAMIFGGVREEHLQFNESTLWSGRPRAFVRADAGNYLPLIRQWLSEGKQAEAEQLAEAHFMGLKDAGVGGRGLKDVGVGNKGSKDGDEKEY